MNTLAERRLMIEEMSIAEEKFLNVMDFINHSNSSFEDKQAWATAYKQAYPLWSWKHSVMQDALDSLNPAYVGLTQYRTCGLKFFMKHGDLLSGVVYEMQTDIYLNTETGTSHRIRYSINRDNHCALILVDSKKVWTGKAAKIQDLYSTGENYLLAKIGAIPF